MKRDENKNKGEEDTQKKSLIWFITFFVFVFFVK
jgi:hypothetical protein